MKRQMPIQPRKTRKKCEMQKSPPQTLNSPPNLVGVNLRVLRDGFGSFASARPRR